MHTLRNSPLRGFFLCPFTMSRARVYGSITAKICRGSKAKAALADGLGCYSYTWQVRLLWQVFPYQIV